MPDILFGDSEILLYAKLNGESVGVPSRLALHVEALHCLVAAENIFDCACHDMMYARHSVCGGGTLVEYKRRVTFTQLHAACEYLLLAPLVKNLAVDVGEIE